MNSAKTGNAALGRRGEDAAARYLSQWLGWTIADRNWRCPEGEIDIVAHDGRRHVVCEVKTRSSDRYGAPIEAITPGKAGRLRRLAGRWAAAHGVPALTIRIDVLGLTTGAAAPADGVVQIDGFEIDHHRGVC